jgi:hypothetical protein
MQAVRAAVGILRVFGWLSLVAGLVLMGVYIAQGANVMREEATAPTAPYFLLIAALSLLGGLFMWAVCIVRAAAGTYSMDNHDILRQVYMDEESNS